MPALLERLGRGRDKARASELASGPDREWAQGIGNWARLERQVRRLQGRIFSASRKGKWRKVKHLQRLLALSRSAKLLAIHDVTERNKGRFTPGVDGLVYLTAEAREELSHEKFDYRKHQPQPAKRGYIPKPGGRTRPLGIPTVRDRVMEAIVKVALEPEWEAKFEANSYGFRLGRSCHDAVEAIRLAAWAMKARGHDVWILEADIASCFDRIAHEPLLARLHLFRDITRRWLEAGVVESGHWEPTEEGTPQGGVISPLLANIALDGLERLFAGKWWARVVRYADDFVVVTPTRRIAERGIRQRVEKFLGERGLELNPEKTGVTSLSQGFNFLGFTFREFGGKRLVTPQKEKVQRFLRRMHDILARNKQSTQKQLLVLLNPAIRGWAMYFRFCNAKRVFARLDHLIFWKLWRWSRRRHPEKTREWVWRKYFAGGGERHWSFGEEGGFRLHHAAGIPLLWYRKVAGAASPLDPRLRKYWENRVRYVVATL